MLPKSKYPIIDYETKSLLDLSKVGSVVYAKYRHTHILCAAWGFGETGKLWIPSEGQPFPEELAIWILEGKIVECHGAGFDPYIHEYKAVPLGAPPVAPEQWRCSMARCAIWTVPRGLDEALKAMKLPVRKDKARKAQMLKASKPRNLTQKDLRIWEDSPEVLEDTYAYALQDYKAQRCLSSHLPMFTSREFDVWSKLDRVINQRGIYVNLRVCKIVKDRLEVLRNQGREWLHEYTRGMVSSETKEKDLHRYCRSKGVELKNLQKEYLQQLMKEGKLPNSVKKVIEFRLEFKKASVAKYESLVNRVDPDTSRLYYPLVYAGASRTSRWAGEGTQIHNMFRSLDSHQNLITQLKEIILAKDFHILADLYGSEMVAYGSLVRSVFEAPKGKMFYCADFSGVEARILFWLSGNHKYLHAIAIGKDPYIMLAASIFMKPYESVTKKDRMFGKKGILSLGYGLGDEAFYDNCDNDPFVPTVTREFTDRVYSVYHRDNPETKIFWRKVEDCMKRAVKTGLTQKIRNDLLVSYRNGDLFIKLPSGRSLRYAETRFHNGSLRCMAINSKTKQWGPYDLWGSRVTGHIVQGLARDVMVDGMFTIEKHGVYPLVGTFHDEGLSEGPENGSIEEYCSLLGAPKSYMEDCPISVEGWKGRNYTK